MPRGKRQTAQGIPGQAYGQRTDLNQPVMVASGQPYGARQAQEAAQQAIPLPSAPPVSEPVSPRPQEPTPGSLGAFGRATERPTEPLTAGMPMGPGPGPEAMVGNTGLTPDDLVLAKLRALMAAHPNGDVAALLTYYEGKQA